MSRRRAALWLLSVPLMVVGSQVAHALAYWFVYPESELRLHELLLTGHGYMNFGVPWVGGYLPLLMAAVGALEVIACGWVVSVKVRGRPQTPVPAWAFALVPIAGFSLQEFLERWLAGAASPGAMMLEPTFRVGLLLQIPFALVALMLARLLLRVAVRVAGALARKSSLSLGAIELPRRVPLGISPPRLAVLARGYAGRGPPIAVGPATVAFRL